MRALTIRGLRFDTRAWENFLSGVCISSRHSRFLPVSKNMHVRRIGNSDLALGVSATVQVLAHF